MGTLSFTDIADQGGLTRYVRAYAQREVPAIVQMLVMSGADQSVIRQVKDIPVTLAVTVTGAIDFGSPERERAARALQYGSHTMHVPQVYLLSKLVAHVDAELARVMERALIRR